MADRTVTVPIDPIDRGIDRLDTDVRNGKVVKALNVINDDGDLRRRDAYRTVYTAAPHFRPDGLVAVQAGTGTGSETLTSFTDRAGTFTTSQSILYVGCDEKFDGIDLSVVSFSTTPTSSAEIQAYFHNGTAWTSFTVSGDTTAKGAYNADADAYHFTSLCKEGRVTWHTDELTNWTKNNTSKYGGVALGSTKYWVALQLVNNAGSTVNLRKQLLKASECLTNRINGIFRKNKRQRCPCYLFRQRKKKGSEKSMVGVAETPAEPTKVIHLIEEGSGIYNQVTIPQWTESTGSEPTSRSVQGSRT